MRAPLRLALAGSTAAVLSLSLLSPVTSAAPGAPGKPTGNPAGKSIELTLAGTHETGIYDGSASEIPAFDKRTGRAFVVNAQSGAVDVLSIGKDASPSEVGTIEVEGLLAADGSTVEAGAVVNSVDVSGGILAVAVEADDKVDHGWVLFFDTTSFDYLGGVRGGALPDSLAFTPNGSHVVVANEGEPADDFSSDPEGTISVIEVPKNANQFPKKLTQASVKTVDFRQFDEGTRCPRACSSMARTSRSRRARSRPVASPATSSRNMSPSTRPARRPMSLCRRRTRSRSSTSRARP